MDASPLEADAWVNGGPHNIEDLHGKVVLLNYFTAQHPPCVESLPELCDWQSLYGDEGLIVIGVTPYQNLRWNSKSKKASFDRHRAKTSTDRDEELKVLNTYAKQHRLNFPIAVLDRNVFNRQWAVYRFSDLPGIVVIDRGQKVHTVRRRKNEHDGNVINKALNALLLLNNAGANTTTTDDELNGSSSRHVLGLHGRFGFVVRRTL